MVRQTARKFNDTLFTSLFEYLEALYIYSVNKEEILEVFKYLEENKIFAYIEELSLEVSNQYLERKDHRNSIEFLQKMMYGQTKIKKGGVSMSIKKLVIPILAAALLTMGISVVSATDQSDGVYQIATRKQT